MICSCEKEFAVKYFPHQISYATDYKTKDVLPVTIGFQPGTCNECRGFPEEPHPKAEIYGATSKIKRYYWREIEKIRVPMFAEWATNNGYIRWTDAIMPEVDKFNEFGKVAVDKIKKFHKETPKYIYFEESETTFLEKNNIEVVYLKGLYGSDIAGIKILNHESWLSPEEYVAKYYQELGYSSIMLESRPFHMLFSVFLGRLLQDQNDEKVQFIYFGDRRAFDDESYKGRSIRLLFPSDFGCEGYYLRRQDVVNEYLSLLPNDNNECNALFDNWINDNYEMRQYLWVYSEADRERARKVLQIIGSSGLKKILKFLIMDYWKRYLGWPDLIIYNENEYFFAEVKSKRDKLRLDQRSWIQWNNQILHIPYKLIKILNIES